MMPVLRNVQWKSVWLTNKVILPSSLTSSLFFVCLDFLAACGWERKLTPVGTAFLSHHQFPPTTLLINETWCPVLMVLLG